MQGLLIALSVLAGIVVLVIAVALAGALYSVHAVLGARKSSNEVVPESVVDLKYGGDYKWFDAVKPNTSAVSITAFDGIKLSAILIKHGESNNRVAICCHGYGVTYKSVQMQAQLFYDRGFDVLLPSMRGHGASEGNVGMAWLDRFDVLRWVDMVIEHYGKSVGIALLGVSMGGASVIGAAGMNPPSQLKCVIDDCGFSSQNDQYAVVMSGKKKSERVLFSMFNIGLKMVHGYSFKDADFVPFAADMTVPALFIHGDADKVVPLELGQKLYDACGSAHKKQLIVKDAGHATAYATDCRAYMNAVDELIDKCFRNADPRPEGLLPIEAERVRIEEEQRQKEEQARLAAEEAEKERAEKERLEKEEQERIEQERLQKEQAEKEEQARLEQEQSIAAGSEESTDEEKSEAAHEGNEQETDEQATATAHDESVQAEEEPESKPTADDLDD